MLVFQTLAVMPAYTLAALRPLPDVPVVVWTAHRQRRLPGDFDHAAITSEGATVGTPMLTNTLVRAGRPFELVVGRIDDGESLAAVGRALLAGAVATRLRRSRIGRVGPVFEGYDCVDADDARLRAATGIQGGSDRRGRAARPLPRLEPPASPSSSARRARATASRRMR